MFLFFFHNNQNLDRNIYAIPREGNHRAALWPLRGSFSYTAAGGQTSGHQQEHVSKLEKSPAGSAKGAQDLIAEQLRLTRQRGD